MIVFIEIEIILFSHEGFHAIAITGALSVPLLTMGRQSDTIGERSGAGLKILRAFRNGSRYIHFEN